MSFLHYNIPHTFIFQVSILLWKKKMEENIYPDVIYGESIHVIL